MRGKRRIHQKPTVGEVKRYRWWLDKELELVRPKLVVALGSTAALALAGRSLSIGRNRGEIRLGERKGYVTVHPSYLLRIPDEDAKAQAYKDFVRDLRRIHQMAA
jgi:DNA polymerase